VESEEPRPFDVRTIRYLIKLMGRHDLSEIDLREGTQRIRLRRGPEGVSVPMGMPAPVFTSAPTPVSTTAPVVTAEVAKPNKALLEIKSPMVGTFYSQAKPGVEPFIKVGSRVTPDTVVGLIMAMKMNNDIKAECSGVIVDIVTKNDQGVEYDTVLFRVDPSA